MFHFSLAVQNMFLPPVLVDNVFFFSNQLKHLEITVIYSDLFDDVIVTITLLQPLYALEI